MKFREYYRGLCATIRFDYHTGTHIGELIGVPSASFIEASSYDDLKVLLKQAADDHLAGGAVNAEEEWARAVQLEQARIRKDAEKLKQARTAKAA